MGKVVLAVGAHTNDIEYGCAPTLKRHKEKGDEVFGLVLSRGKRENHCPVYNGHQRPPETPTLDAITLLNFRDEEIKNDGRTISTILSYIKMYDPSTIYSHTPDDVHEAHRHASLAAIAAAKICEKNIHPFESPSTAISLSSSHSAITSKEYLRRIIRRLSSAIHPYAIKKIKTARIVLAVGAHPDDIELGCGGTLNKHKEDGDYVYTLVISRGERGNHCPRYTECEDSAEVLGLDGVTILNFKDAEIRDDFYTVSAIEKYIRLYDPEIVYSHTINDRHQDHRNVSLAASSAARGHGKNILLFEPPSVLTSFTPHHFVILTKEQVDKKIAALHSYQSQLAKNSVLNLEWITTKAKYWGYMEVNGKGNGDAYAEVFESNHTVWK